MAEGIAVSKYGTDLAGALADRPSNAPAGLSYFATDTNQFFITQGGNVWQEPGGAPPTAVAGATITVGAEASNVINVGVQLTDAVGNNVATIGIVHAYLSDSATGDGIAATAPSGGIAKGTDGEVLVEFVTDKVFLLSSEADGNIDIDVTETGIDTWYLVVVLPTGEKVISGAITFA